MKSPTKTSAIKREPVKRSVPKGLPRSHIVRDAIFPAPTKTTLFYWAKVSCATRQQARAVVKLHGMTHDQRILAIRNAFFAHSGYKQSLTPQCAAAMLAALNLPHP